MIELKGKYNKDCKIFIDDVEPEAIGLIQSILDQQISDGVPVRIMPDCHAGVAVCIGFTMPLTSLLNPGLVGVDIGCGMASARFSIDKLNLEKLDIDIRKRIPMGFEVHESSVFKSIPFDEVQRIADIFTKKYNEKFNTSYIAPVYNEKWLMTKLKDINMDVIKFHNAIGTLGGGNHFCELGKDSKGNYWITVHSGSRNFGLKIAGYWTNVAKGKVVVMPESYNKEMDYILQKTVPKSEIPKKLKELKEKYKIGVNKEFLSGDNLVGYLYDMIFAQTYALWNRTTMINIIKDVLRIKSYDEVINTIHNYIDFNDFIIRKGAIPSYVGQRMIIPFNMRDGILLCEGKSNSDWNNSAPHGAGRLMSRTAAKSKIDMDHFRRSMKDVYSTSVTKETLDESPMAYKDSSIIESAIEPTALIIDRIKPILNIKDAGKSESWKERKLSKKQKVIERKSARRQKYDRE